MSWWIRILYSLELMKSGTSIEGRGSGMMFAKRERERGGRYLISAITSSRPRVVSYSGSSPDGA
jgi:hypothetical protein